MKDKNILPDYLKSKWKDAASVNAFKEVAIEYIYYKLCKGTRVIFKNNAFSFYDDTCGQRLYEVKPYIAYGREIKNHLKVTRTLAFENEIDKGKEGAVLGIINLDKLNLIEIKENSIVFDLLTIYL